MRAKRAHTVAYIALATARRASNPTNLEDGAAAHGGERVNALGAVGPGRAGCRPIVERVACPDGSSVVDRPRRRLPPSL